MTIVSAVTLPTMSVKLPKSLTDSLVTAFMAESRRVCRDAAKILYQPEADVLKILKAMPQIQFQIIDDSEIPNTCPVLIQKESVIERCRTGCILGTGRCVKHQDISTIPQISESLIQLTRVRKLHQDDTPIWCNEATKEILDAAGTVIGELTEDNEIIMYTLE